MVPTSAHLSLRCPVLASAPAFHPARHFHHETCGSRSLGLAVIIISWIPSKLWPARTMKGGEIIVLGFSIRHPILLAKLTPRNFSIRNQLISWVVVETEIFYHINVD
jgi:hypothetical protein